MLRVMTYVVSYKLFWNWIGVVRFVSHEVWFDQGFVNWHFLHYCFVPVVSLWSLSIGVQIIFTTRELVEEQETWDQIHHWMIKKKKRRKNVAAGKIFSWNKMRRRQDFSNRMRRRPDFATESWWVVCHIDLVCDSFFIFSHFTVENLICLINHSIN